MSKLYWVSAFALTASLGIAQAQMNGRQSPPPTDSPAAQSGQMGSNTMGSQSQTMPDSMSQTAGTGQAGNPPSQAKTPAPDDGALQQSVQQQLATNPAFAGVTASSHNGKVELTGSVPTKDDRKRAKETAKTVPGVKDVKEHLSVGGGPAAAPSRGATGSDPNQNTAGSISGNSGRTPANSTPDPGAMNSRPDTAAPPPQSTPPTVPPNNTTNPPQTIAQAGNPAQLVYASYQEAAFSTSQNEQSQSAASQGQSAPAPAEAAHPNTSMGPTPIARAKGGGDNSTLRSQIDSAIRNEPTLANSHVTVSVTDDIVQLNGTVASEKAKQTAGKLARSYATNRKVADNLTVTGHGRSDMAPDHPAMNNSGTGNAVNPNTGTTEGNSSTPPQN